MKKLKLKLIAIIVATMTTTTLPSLNASAAWIQNGSDWNYLSDSGDRQTGWINDNGTWYYLDNSGTMKTGWVNDDGTWYYLQPSGEMQTGWVNDDGTWYYMQLSGAMQTGWVNDNGTWYYMQPSGAMRTGWINDNGIKYFAAASGAMQTGVVQVDGKTYFLDSATGAMKVGNVTLNGKVYTFAQTGEATGKDTPIFTKVFNSNGIEITDASNPEKNNNGSDVSNTSTTSQQNDSSNSHHHSSSSSNGGSNNTGGGSNNTGGGSSNTGGGSSNTGASVNYLEDYREQYHYSPAKAWANDPNGMVYFNGEYHLFYQYNPDASVWGPMHWGHAVSKDLIHWTELPIALAPDDGGTIYSGSAVIDKDNTTGFFDGIAGGGLVAIYTQDYMDNGAEKQKECIAYSKDNGRTWTKYAGNPVIAAENDPLNNSAFRDPKVFYNDGKWFMVVAGGPLRFFSSTDLKTWKPEGMQPEIQTECPDIYKLEVGDTGTYKWVLSEGGRYYRVGDFKEVDGVWKFVTDNDEHLPMNFAKDAYAAQTYYGTGENGTPDGRRIMINWMNNWDYCNNVAPITKTFNGSFDLQTELKLVNTDAGIRLIQQPIDEYKTLRKSPTIFNNVTISPDQPNVMSNLSGSQYEIVAEFAPDASTTEVGFKLRVGKSADQETIVKYNTQTEEVTLDRSKSGKSPSADKFLQAYSQKMGKTSDGKIQLHIFVDAASVEVYGNNGEVTGSAQIFPNRSSDGIEVYSVGGNSTATIQYYPLSSIWNNEVAGKDSVLVSLSEGDLGKKVGDEFTIYTATVPETVEQGVTWTFDSNILEIVNQDDEKTTFKTKGVGNTNLTATSKDQKSSKTINVSVYDSNPSSIIKDLTNFETTGDWYVKDNGYTGSSSGDGFAVAQETNVSGKVSSLKADADVSDGSTAGLVLLSKSANPKEGSIIANINKNGEYRVFVFTGLDANGNPQVSDLNSGIVPKTDDSIYKLKAEVSDGHIKYWINDELVCDTKQSYYETGRFGLNVYGGATSFKNVNISNDVPSTETSISGSGLTFDNTPKDLHVSDDSYVVDGGKNNNGFAISDQNIDTSQGTYTLDVDSKMLGDWHNQNPANGDVAGVVLFAQGDNYFGDGGIIANVGKWGHYRLFGQVPDGNGGMKEVVFAEGDVPEAQYNRYHLKVELNGNHIIYGINNKKVCDITQDYYTTGKFGLNVWNGASEFRNITLTNDTVASTVQTLAEAKTAAENALTNFTATNATTEEDILDAIKSKITNPDIKAEFTAAFNKVDASVGTVGSISGTVTLTLTTDGTTETVDVNKEIAALPAEAQMQTLAEAKTAAENALTNFTATNATTEADILDAIKSKITNPDIKAEFTAAFNKVDASVGTAGSASGTVTLTLTLTTNGTTETVDVNKEIAAL